MKKIAIIATTKDAFVFNLVGIEKIFVVKTTEEAKNIIEKYKNQDYALIFIENNIFEKIQKTINLEKNNETTTFAPFPNLQYFKKDNSTQNLTYETIKKIVGADLIV